jgi:hypothetical protein
MTIAAFDVADSPQQKAFVDGISTGTGIGASVALTSVTIHKANGTTESETAGGADTSTHISFAGGVATVSGLGSGDRIEWTTAAPHDRVLIKGVAGKFDVGAFDITQAQPTPDQKLDFVIRATDGDGDSATASFSIGIDGTGIYDDGQVAGVGSALTAASLGDGAGAGALTEQRLQRALAAAMEHWYAAGLAPQQLSALGQVTFHLTDLPGALLGWASGREIWIDVDAAGWGWSFGAAPGRMDLADAVEHELGHVLGFGHSETGVMAATLAAGVAPVAGPASVPSGHAMGFDHGVSAEAAAAGLTPVAPRAAVGVGAPALAFVVPPATRGTDGATAVTAERGERILLPAPAGPADAAVLLPSRGPALAAAHSGAAQEFASDDVALPSWATPAALAASLDWLFSGGGNVTPPAEVRGLPTGEDALPLCEPIDLRTGAGGVPVLDAAPDRLFEGDGAAAPGPAPEPVQGAVGAASVVLGVGYLAGARLVERPKHRRPALRRL